MRSFKIHTKEQEEALFALSNRNTFLKVRDLYDDVPEVARALNTLIENFEYPNFADKTVSEIVSLHTKDTYPPFADLLPEFFIAVDGLIDTHQEFQSGKIKSVQHSDARGRYIADALLSLAKSFGMELKAHLHIDARGEFYLTCNRFGHDFVRILNHYEPRTGTLPGAHLTDSSNWCNMNHFNAEKLVMDYCANWRQVNLGIAFDSEPPVRKNKIS